MMDNPFSRFIFATGIENSYPTVEREDGTVVRVDEMESCGHYRRWKEDFDLVRDLGIHFLRYGPPYYRTHLGPGRYDWSFADDTFARLRELGIVPIVDLCHFGVPDWIGGFQNPDWPAHFAEYAKAFAKRFPWIWCYTPVNEIFIAATFSAKYGWWNERLRSERAFVTALKHLCQANVLAMRAIREVHPHAVFIQSESSEYYHARTPDCMPHADFLNEKRFLALDLTYGHSVTVEVYNHLLDHGMTRAEYEWFHQNHVKGSCVMGTDYYATNEHMTQPGGGTVPSGEIFGYYVLTSQYYRRYLLPVMHTETNVLDAEKAPAWLEKEWANVHRLQQDNIPVIGFTWYSLTDQTDWDSALRNPIGNVNPCGLYDLDRKIRPVGQRYKELVATWSDLMIPPNQAAGLEFRLPSGEASRQMRGPAASV
jgi:beta-glucosidase/6-phospho-beta-glucosidase/beta-galactosidase